MDTTGAMGVVLLAGFDGPPVFFKAGLEFLDEFDGALFKGGEVSVFLGFNGDGHGVIIQQKRMGRGNARRTLTRSRSRRCGSVWRARQHPY